MTDTTKFRYIRFPQNGTAGQVVELVDPSTGSTKWADKGILTPVLQAGQPLPLELPEELKFQLECSGLFL